MSFSFTLKSVDVDTLAAQSKAPTAVEQCVADFLLALTEAGVGTDYPAAITDTLTQDGNENHVGIAWDDLPKDLRDAVVADTRGKGGAKAAKGIPTVVRKINALHTSDTDKYPLRAAHQSPDGLRPWKMTDTDKPTEGFLFVGIASLFPTRNTDKSDKSDANESDAS
ncbi:MAG TPA: hypothetical protein VF077_08530 [Nitrospiraceae bacterium]